MSFDGSLGYVQIASDFRIVTPLQEQIDDLLFPRSHLSKFVFHALHLTESRLGGPQVALRRLSFESANPELGSLCFSVRASARPLEPLLGY